MKAIRLRTEYLEDPVGIDIVKPRLFWNCADGVVQTAYRVTAEADGRLLWDSGRVESASMRTEWPGEPLKSRMRVLWRVTLWDETGVCGEPSEAFFETGLLESDDWQAAWIAGDYAVNPFRRYPVDCFRRTFDAKSVVKARLYVTACGLYEARVNGARVGAFIMAPGVTDYRKRVQYQTYDVTPLLRDGENVAEVWLADGWYRGSCGAWGLKNQYGTQTKLLFQLELTHADGTVGRVCSDGTWSWSNDGPIRLADNQDGEVIDARMTPSYSGKAKFTKHHVAPTASNNVPVTERKRLSARLVTTPSGKTVLDFGQNLAGYVSFKLNAHAGQRVLLRFGEMLDEAGEFTQKNIQCATKHRTTPLQRVEYVCAEGENAYKTRFAVFGFQYMLVETEVPFSETDFTAIAVSSALERAGWFESSHPLLNRFADSTVWSLYNNSLDLPTDCPTRERHGWTGDAQIFQRTAAYLTCYTPFMSKYLADVYDWQKRDGRLPQIAPYGGTDFYMWVMNGSAGWSDVGIFAPYRIWKTCGDTHILKKYYAGMKAFAGFMIRRIGRPYPTARPTGLRGKDKKYIVNCGQSFGEWAEPADVYPLNWFRELAVPHPEVSTAYTAYVLRLMREIAEALGETADAARYGFYAENCKAAYRALRHSKDDPLDTDRQAELVRPLYMELLDDNDAAYAKKRLLEALERYGWRIGTGFLSTPLILYVLSDIDIESAYRLLENEDMPGWLFMPKSGGNTIWESWEGRFGQGGIASLDHYSKGACVEWLFSTMCGIQVAGENRFTMAPRPGGRFTYAKAAYQSVYGFVESGWERENGKTVFRITIPPNCTARVRLPDGSVAEQSAGTAVYRCAVS